MPVPLHRDLDQTGLALQRWMRSTVAADTHVEGVYIPPAVGNANETILFHASWSQDGIPHDCELVLRLAPVRYPVFMDADLGKQYALLRELKDRCHLAVPHVRWFESELTWLDSPFLIMDRIPGMAPTDNPSFHSPDSWVAELPLQARQIMWRQAIEGLCSIHTATERDQAESLVRRSAAGKSGLEQELAYWRKAATWSRVESPYAAAAWNWLVGNVPPDPVTGLAWGDARVENMLFDETGTCTGIIDWEMACLAGPLADLSWWIFFDCVGSTLQGLQRIEGFGDISQTCDAWNELTGVPTDGIEWYLVFSAYRLAVILARMAHLNSALGAPSPDGFADLPWYVLDVLRSDFPRLAKFTA